MVNKSLQGFVHGQGEAETVALGPLQVTFLATGEETGGAFTMMEFFIPPPQGGTGLHLHKEEDEVGYVVEGTCHYTIGAQTGMLSQGSCVFVPRGTPHEFTSSGPGPFRVVGMFLPAGFEGFWKELARMLTGASGPPDPAAIVSLQEKYHMYMVDTGEKMKSFAETHQLS